MHAGIHAGADGGHRLRLGEDLRVRPDADFEILAPRALLDQHLLQLHRLRPSRASAWRDRRRPAGSPRRGCAAAALRSPRARSSITRSSIDTAKVTPARLDRLQVDRRQQPGPRRVARLARRVGEHGVERPERFARGRAQRGGGIGASHRSRMVGKRGGNVDQPAVAHRDHRRAAEIRPPDAPGERGAARHPRAAPAAAHHECRHRESSHASRRHPILCGHGTERRQDHEEAVRLVARDRARDLSRHAHRRGVAREAVARRSTRCCASTAPNAPAPAR